VRRIWIPSYAGFCLAEPIKLERLPEGEQEAACALGAERFEEFAAQDRKARRSRSVPCIYPLSKKLRSKREKVIALRAKVVGLKKAALPPVVVLTKLSELLDDQTFLFGTRMEGAAVTITGMSSDASRLAQRLGTIEASKSVKFSGLIARSAVCPGPLHRDPRNGSTITSDVSSSAGKKGFVLAVPLFWRLPFGRSPYSPSLSSS
jgi:hypothetical protein